MQRLIDANAFLERTRKDPLFPLVERYGLSSVIEHEPTVEAIPVEWLVKWFHERFKGRTLNDLLEDWEKENGETE